MLVTSLANLTKIHLTLVADNVEIFRRYLAAVYQNANRVFSLKMFTGGQILERLTSGKFAWAFWIKHPFRDLEDACRDFSG
jgi:hypothetical protein